MAANFLPLLLLGGAAFAIASAGKKRSRGASAKQEEAPEKAPPAVSETEAEPTSPATPALINRGSYSYMSDCSEIWMGELSGSEYVKLAREEAPVEAIPESTKDFILNTVSPLLIEITNDVAAEVEDGIDDYPLPLIEVAFRMVDALTPECEVFAGDLPMNNVGGFIFTLMATMQPFMWEPLFGIPTEEALKAAKAQWDEFLQTGALLPNPAHDAASIVFERVPSLDDNGMTKA